MPDNESDAILAAMDAELGSPEGEQTVVETEEKEEPKPKESGQVEESPEDSTEAEPEDQELATEPEPTTEEDRLKNFREKLSAAGLKNQAEQAERWYQKNQQLAKEAEELRKYRQEREAQEAETAKRRGEADDILANAPADLKSEWGRYRQENGDRAFINAYQRYLNKLRKESPEDYERETLRSEQRRLEGELQKERQERERFQRELARREFLTERDSTLRSLQVAPKDFDKLAKRVDGAYVAEYMRIKQERGEEAAEGLRVSEIAKLVVAEMKAERDALRDEVKKQLLEEARENKEKKAPKRRNESPPAAKGRRAQDLDAEVEREIADAIIAEYKK